VVWPAATYRGSIHAETALKMLVAQGGFDQMDCFANTMSGLICAPDRASLLAMLRKLHIAATLYFWAVRLCARLMFQLTCASAPLSSPSSPA